MKGLVPKFRKKSKNNLKLQLTIVRTDKTYWTCTIMKNWENVHTEIETAVYCVHSYRQRQPVIRVVRSREIEFHTEFFVSVGRLRFLQYTYI